MTRLASVSCVIVAFHDPASLDRLLSGLVHPEVAVVVVNVENDGSVGEVVRRHGARHVPLTGNPGYAAAVNAGARSCSTETVVFMNDDVVARASQVLSLHEALATGDADVVVPAVDTRRGDRELTIAALPTPRSLALEWLILPDQPVRRLQPWLRVEKWRAPDRPERVQAASAILVATTAKLLSEVPLPEEYFLYWEESAWFWELNRRGARVEFVPDVVVVHEGGRGEVRPDKSRLLARNAVRCIRRTQGRAAAALALPVVIAWNLRLAIVAALRAAVRPGSEARRLLRSRLAGLRASLAAVSEVTAA